MIKGGGTVGFGKKVKVQLMQLGRREKFEGKRGFKGD